jgi:hypothetical protein
VISGPLDERVRDRIIAETRGNPLALLELPRGIPAAQLGGGFGLPSVRGVVEGRYTMESTDGPLESARIRCPRGHWFNGPVEYLTVPRHGHGRHDAGGRPRGGNPDSRGGSWRVPAS